MTTSADFKHQVILWQIGSFWLNNGDLRLESFGRVASFFSDFTLSPKEAKNRIDSYRT